MPRIPAASQKTQKTETNREPSPAPEPPKQPPAVSVKVIERRIETVVVEIPLGEPPHRFEQVHVEGWLRRDAANTFARLRQALRDQGTRTANGRTVVSNPDVLRWLMEQFDASSE